MIDRDPVDASLGGCLALPAADLGRAEDVPETFPAADVSGGYEDSISRMSFDGARARRVCKRLGTGMDIWSSCRPAGWGELVDRYAGLKGEPIRGAVVARADGRRPGRLTGGVVGGDPRDGGRSAERRA